MELFEDLGNRPIVFVRFNPDSYVSSEEEKTPGCFKDTKTAGLSLNKNEFKRRVDTLLSIVSKHQETIPEKEVTVYNLFYDGYD